MPAERAMKFMIRRGYRDIVVEDHREWEDVSGYQYNNERTTLLARNPSGEPQRIAYSWCSHKSSEGLLSEVPIDEATFCESAATHGIKDGPGVAEQVAAEDAAHRAEMQDRFRAQAEFTALRPVCPECSAIMEFRHSTKSGGYFWGCSQFARGRCRGTRSIAANDLEHLISLVKRGAH
jgi:hypothetical protein